MAKKETTMTRRNILKALRNPMLIKVAVVALLLLFVFFFSHVFAGKVISVQDGDTITVISSKGERKKIRVYGIDCPEYRQRGGIDATNFTKNLVFMENVSLQVIETDQYGREVAIVTLPNGKILNEELVREGHAWVYRRFCKRTQCKKWGQLETQARKEKKGLWSQKNPLPPWQWRWNNK